MPVNLTALHVNLPTSLIFLLSCDLKFCSDIIGRSLGSPWSLVRRLLCSTVHGLEGKAFHGPSRLHFVMMSRLDE